MAADISLIVATYNRSTSLLELLGDLTQQDLESAAFEVIVVDDGSATPVRPLLEGQSWPFRLETIEQANAGQAAARDAGIRRAAGDVVVVVDDDMRLPPHFLSAHLHEHRRGNSLVLGHILSAPQLHAMPLFERFHARQLEAFAAGVRQGARVRGAAVCTGNVSFRRADYLAVGGFDRTLGRSEDRDLGIRLEQAGARITYCERACTTHQSDHMDLGRWLRRARLYGKCDAAIADKHPALEYIDPWRFLFEVNPISRPLLLLATLSPLAGTLLARSAMAASRALDGGGFDSVAVAGTTLVYGLEYFIGVREHEGTLGNTARGLAAYCRKRLAGAQS